MKKLIKVVFTFFKITAIVIGLTIWGTLSVGSLMEVSDGRPISLFPVEHSSTTDLKKGLGIFFALISPLFMEAGYVGEQRLEAWDKKVQEWSTQWNFLRPFNKVLSGNMRIRTKEEWVRAVLFVVGGYAFMGVFCSTVTDTDLGEVIILGVTFLVLTVWIFFLPFLLFPILILLPITFPLFLYRVTARVADNDKLERTLKLIGFLLATAGVLLLL
jgi:hypothetical protein